MTKGPSSNKGLGANSIALRTTLGLAVANGHNETGTNIEGKIDGRAAFVLEKTKFSQADVKNTTRRQVNVLRMEAPTDAELTGGGKRRLPESF